VNRCDGCRGLFSRCNLNLSRLPCALICRE
jgi:hypothetical protein